MDLIFLKRNFVGLFGVCIYSIFFANSLNAASYTWECIKNRSYLIEDGAIYPPFLKEDGELIEHNIRIKQSPPKFISTLNEKSKYIIVTFSLGTGNAKVNGISGKVTGFSEEKKFLEKTPNQPIVIFLNNLKQDETKKETYFVDREGKEKLEKTEVLSILKDATINFVLNINNNLAKFVSTELTEISTDQYTFKANDVVRDESLDIKNLIEVSTGECRLLKNKIN